MHILDMTANVWDTMDIQLSRLRALDVTTLDQQKSSLLNALDRVVCGFVTSNDFTTEKYKPIDPFKADEITPEMLRAANLL